MIVPIEVTYDKEIDARDGLCPGPLLELIRGIRGMPVGAIVAVLASDPGSAKDIPLWIEKSGHEYLGAYDERDYTRFVVRKAH